MTQRRFKGLVLVGIAGVLYSTAGLFIRALHDDTWTILAWRAVFGTAFMLAWLAVEKRGAFWGAFNLGWREIGLAVQTAFGGFFYVFALKATTVANVMVIYATLPFVTMAVAWVWTRERPAGRMLVAGALALVGVLVMMAGGGGGAARLLGVFLTLLMNLSFALILVSSRENPKSTTAVFTVGLALSGVIAFAFAPSASVTPGDFVLIALFGIVTIGLAMALYMAGARLIPPAEVGLLAIVDVAIGPLLVWVGFGEAPGVSASLGGAIVIAALIWHLWPDLRGSRKTVGLPVA